MSKRFTDTNKFKKPFHRSLPGPYKLLWDYLYHDCDHAGIWHVDFEVAQIYIGKDMPVTEEDALKYFNQGEERIKVLPGGKWFILPFIPFQYECAIEDLNDQNSAHRGIIKVLINYGLIEATLKPLQRGFKGASKPLKSTCQGTKDKDKDKDKDKRPLSPRDPKYIFLLPTWIDPAIWEKYLEMRKSKKNVPTEYAKYLVMVELEKLKKQGQDVTAVLNQSIRRKWIDVYAVKVVDQNGQPCDAAGRELKYV